MSWLQERFAAHRSEAGLTLIELLVAMSMAVVIVGAVGTMLVSAMRNQPRASERAQSISSARWVLERFTREIRNGIVVEAASPSSVSFRTYVRRTTCGSGTVPSSGSPAIECRVTYSCTTTTCTRAESPPPPAESTPAPKTVFSGLNSSQVFCYVPSTNTNPSSCGPVSEDVSDTTYIGITLNLATANDPTAITISDGASLRNAILSN
jgi:Tfp pilus assembly protein PilW